MTAENTAYWEKLGTTDPDQTKTFQRAGGFKGTAIKPVYTELKMTEVFGPCGIGWGMSEPTFQVLPGADGEVLVYCWLSLWVLHNGVPSAPIPGVGGDKIITKSKDALRSDDEAFKKAFTDAIGNAMKHLGMSADVHMGRFDDSKYVSSVRESKAKSRGPYEELQTEVDACQSVDDLTMLWRSPQFQEQFMTLPDDWQVQLVDRMNEAKAEFAKPANGNSGYVAPEFDTLPPATQAAVRNLGG